jgi:HK97 family phage portal protein
MDDVTVRGSDSEILEYRIRGKLYDPEHIWHEKQFTVAGLPVGLSPIAYAAWSIGGYLSAQKFANDWFGNGAQHSGVLKNTVKQTLTPEESDVAKTRYREAVADRDIFVTGKDWEFAFANTAGTQASFIEEKQYGISDLARFLGVPGDMIDAVTSKGSITYANVTQRNLQLLIMNIGPAIVRREAALSTILPQPRYVKLNTDAILRMDPAAVVASLAAQIDGRFLAPSEAREIQNRPPFTPEQEAEFDRLFANRSTAPTGGLS